MDFLSVSSLVAFICYLLATFTILSRLFHNEGPNQGLTLLFSTIALIAHTFVNTHILFSGDAININLPNVVSLVSLSINIIIFVAALRFKMNLLLPVVYGFSGSWQLIMLLTPNVDSVILVTDKMILLTHITLALIAYCILVIATLYSFQVAYINMKLKTKNLLAVSHLPPLMQVERQLFMILSIGTVFLFTSELIGLFFLDNFFAKDNIHKTTLSAIALVIYITSLWGHYKEGWRGHKIMTLTLIATSLLTLAYFGSRFVKEFLLS